MKILICCVFISYASICSVYTQKVQLEVDGLLKLMPNDPGSNYTEGTIRWSGNDFVGWNGLAWVSLTGNKEVGKVTDVDGHVYKTIKIGDQTWMAENLKTTRYRDGNSISHITSSQSWEDINVGAYCFYNNDSNNEENFGKLYNWNAVSTGKLCPSGWYMPTEFAWSKLLEYLGNLAGGKMKKLGSAYWDIPNVGANNESAFSAVGGGARDYNGTFYALKDSGFYWSQSEASTSNGKYVRIAVNYAGTNTGSTPKESGFSVRCVKN